MEFALDITSVPELSRLVRSYLVPDIKAIVGSFVGIPVLNNRGFRLYKCHEVIRTVYAYGSVNEQMAYNVSNDAWVTILPLISFDPRLGPAQIVHNEDDEDYTGLYMEMPRRYVTMLKQVLNAYLQTGTFYYGHHFPELIPIAVQLIEHKFPSFMWPQNHG